MQNYQFVRTSTLQKVKLISASEEDLPTAHYTRCYSVKVNGWTCAIKADEYQFNFISMDSNLEVSRFWTEISYIELCSKNRSLIYFHLYVVQNPFYPVTVVKFTSPGARNSFVKECIALEVIQLEVDDGFDENGNFLEQPQQTKFKICNFFSLCLKPKPENTILEPVLSKAFFY